MDTETEFIDFIDSDVSFFKENGSTQEMDNTSTLTYNKVTLRSKIITKFFRTCDRCSPGKESSFAYEVNFSGHEGRYQVEKVLIINICLKLMRNFLVLLIQMALS